MNQRIRKLTDLTLKGKMYAEMTATTFDPEDLFLPRREMEVKRLCEYILNQEPVLTEYSKMTGYFNCLDNTVVGEIFHRKGHRHFQELKALLFKKPIDNLVTMEWQHATADYKKVLEKGICGILEEIEQSLKRHTDPEEVGFLTALKEVAHALIGWAHKCAARAETLSEQVENAEYRQNLLQLAQALRRVPEHKPSSFYEAVLAIYVCFSADPDSVGTLDRNLAPFYEADLQSGRLTREEAKEYLQELFLMLQAGRRPENPQFTRGGESHFCIGGYLPDGSDGFSSLSELILESLLELPTWIPQVTLRWTKKTPKEVFRYVMDCERRDPHKRIAFQNDEKRLQSYTRLCGIPYEKAVGYATVGCNEPAFLGTISGSSSIANFARSMETMFHKKAEAIKDCPTFDAFYEVFIQELFSDLDRAHQYDDHFARVRARDENYLSSLFFDGCIEKAKSLTQGTAEHAVAGMSQIGITNVIDSLIVIRQFVFDEQLITMQQLIEVLQANWQGYERLRALILSKGDFFGNDTARSNEVAQRVFQSVYEHLKGQTNLFGYPLLIGDLIGYNPHHKWFGAQMEATPDGRFRGDPLKFGLGQSEGRDRNGLTALLNSIAKVDPNGIGCGSTVTNLMVEEILIRNDDYFEKTVDLLETYFQNGGVHFQLTYVSKEDLLKAKENPAQYQSLRVRVSGFSDYFVNLHEDLQNDVIERTVQK